MRHRVVLVGGYGNIGRAVAERLGDRSAELVIAGRDRVRAEELAREVSGRALTLDLADPATWTLPTGGGVLLMCVDHRDAGFARAAIEQGYDYVDITASGPLIRELEELDGLARAAGRRALLSVGFAPGLSNLLVAECGAAPGDVVHIGLRLGLGEVHGPAALAWTLQAVDRDTAPRPVGADGALGVRVGFADQEIVARTLGVRAETTLTVENSLWTRVLWWSAPLLLRWPRLGGLLGASAGLPWFSDRCGIQVVSGAREARYEGRDEGSITAMMAVFAIDRVRSCDPGVHHIEQVARLADVTDVLEAAGGRLTRSGR
ncbi:MAG: saccharopine dehydrogenase NADP-binding domain-containing protein [Myxococcota bacterium]|nr:saccharopine dehydrogenase NADP-binding domain-containing protein [Myxococcota bacterium]